MTDGASLGVYKQLLRIEICEDHGGQGRPQSLPRPLVPAEQIREALGPVIGGGKDTGAGRARFGFATEPPREQIPKTAQNFGSQQRLKGLQDCGEHGG